LCPICKRLPKVNAFTDSIRFHSNSTINNYSNLAVEGLGYVIIDEKELPLNHYFLTQNYPNPFNPTTKISYSLPQPGIVQIKVYNILGIKVATLVNEYRQAGTYEAEFNAPTLKLPSGVYIYSLRVNDFMTSRKMTLLK
jgi:hypothetical protein